MTIPTPITEAVQAALYFARYKESTLSEYCWSCDKMERELTDQDKDRVSPQLAAAARILADEVERLRKEQQQQSIALSDCCEAPAVVAGKPNSTQWYACPQCCQPCDVFIRTTTTTQSDPLGSSRLMFWQPIETAPKDGSEVLAAVRYPNKGRYVTFFLYWIDTLKGYPDGWCTQWNGFSSRHDTCLKYVLVKIKPIDKLKNPPQPVDKEEWFS